MIYARPIHPHEIANLRWQSRSMSVAQHILSQYIASRQLHAIYTFMVSVPTDGFHFSPTPQLYICGNENLVSKL